MPFRCKNYDDSGHPINGGCRLQGTCGFTHPGDSSWPLAIRTAGSEEMSTDPSLSFNRGEARRKARGRGRSGTSIFINRSGSGGDGKSKAKTVWGGPPLTTPTKNSGWDSSSWDISTSNAFGSSKDTESSSSAWGGGWGNSASNQGGDKSVNASSGDACDGGDGNVQGTTSGSWATGGGDEISGTNGWGSGGGWETGGEDGGDAGTVQSQLPVTTTAHQRDSSTSIPKPQRHSPASPDVQVRTPDASNSLRPAPEGASPTLIDMDWSGVPRPDHAINARAVSPAATEQTTSSSPLSTRCKMSTDRRQVYGKVLKITNRVVRIKLELGKAQSDLEHWKATQLSPQFAHVSHAARAKLNNIRKSYDTQVSDAKKRLSHALATLVELPELSRIAPKVFNPDLDGQKVIAYTEELKDWIVDLRKHLIAITILHESPQPPQRERQDSYEDGQIDSSPPVKRQRLDHEDRPLWTWDDLKSHVSQLEDKIAQAADQLDEAKIFRAFTNLSDIVNETAEEQRRATVAERSESFVPDPVLELSQRADGLGDELGNQASLSAGLLLKIHTGEQTIKLLEVQKQEHEIMKAQVEAQFALFEKWRQEDSERIRQISEQIQNLQAHPRPSPPRTPTIDEILPLSQIHLRVRTALHQEVLPALEALRGESASHIKQRNEYSVNDTFQKLRPTLDMTEGICRRIELEMNLKGCSERLA